MSRNKPQAETLQKHPDEYQRDLNPNAITGQNIGMGETQPSKDARTAYDLKQVHRRLADWTDDNLKQIRILPEGSRLEQGATYIDLNNLNQGEFTATGGMQASTGNLYVAKKDVPYHLWNLLIGIDNPERLADASDMAIEPTQE